VQQISVQYVSCCYSQLVSLLFLVILHFTEPFCPTFDESSPNFICMSPLKQQRPLFRLEAQVSLSHTREPREPLSVGQFFPP
jgi:hypothetical protein